jgi:hypothetical protein
MKMRNGRSHIAGALIGLTVVCLLTHSPLAGVAAGGEKLKPEEVVARHLESLGPAEARQPGRSRVIAGTSLLNLRSGGGGQTSGAAVIASQGEKVLLKAEFDSPSYPFERIGFDGKKLTARPYAPGARSPIAGFFLSHDATFGEGLIGGTLSSAWPLLNLAERRAKLEYAGTEKVNGREAHKLKYMPHEGSELKVKLYFDAENFHHLRTEYERVIPAPMGATPQQSASQRETRYKLVEDFSDFRPEGGMTLPHSYKMQYSVSQYNPFVMDWTFNFEKYTFGFALEAKEFVTDN